MEAVKAFNNELSSLYELKPPISKARMTSITKSAIKAIKFYKHVVQSVEKFIQKCRPDFKIPGLYVIDSIVRQSRHQARKNSCPFHSSRPSYFSAQFRWPRVVKVNFKMEPSLVQVP